MKPKSLWRLHDNVDPRTLKRKGGDFIFGNKRQSTSVVFFITDHVILVLISESRPINFDGIRDPFVFKTI